jgi:hypothetical protein
MRPIKEGDFVYMLFSDDKEWITKENQKEYRKAKVLHMPADVGDLLYIQYCGGGKEIVGLNTSNTNFVGMSLISYEQV